MFARRLAISLLLIASSQTASAQDDATYRQLCTNEAFRKQFEQEIADYDRDIFAYELKDRCPRLDLSSKPVHDSADTAREQSHTNWVYDANYSADGKWIVSAGRDQTVRIWDAQTGKSLHKIPLAAKYAAASMAKVNYVRSAIFLSDGKHIAAGADDKPVEIFDATSGNKTGEFMFAKIKPDHAFPPKLAATSAGLLLMAGNSDDVIAYDTAAQSVKYKVPGHLPDSYGIAASDAAGLGASTSESKVVHLWRLESGEKVKSVKLDGRSTPQALSFSRDGKMLAVVAGGSIHIYAVPEMKLVRTLLSHPKFSVYDVAFTADAKGLLVCRSHPVLWDIETGNIVRHYGPFNDLCHSVDISPDGTKAVTTSMTSDIKIWDIATGTFERRLGIDVHPPR